MIFRQHRRVPPEHVLCAYPEICYCSCACCEQARAQYYVKDFPDEA